MDKAAPARSGEGRLLLWRQVCIVGEQGEVVHDVARQRGDAVTGDYLLLGGVLLDGLSTMAEA